MTARRLLANSLLVAGLAGVDIWLWSHAVPALYQSWEDRQLDREEASPEANPGAAPAPSAGPSPAIPAGQLVGRLSIPRLHLRAIVREGAGESSLSLALGHIPHTALPGQIGNIGVAGHRDTIFRGLRGIRKNDLILIETRHGNFAYRVEGTEIVKPDDVAVLHPGHIPELTLVTCYPFYYVGSAPDRFIVKARQVTDNSTNAVHSARSRRARRV